MAWDPNVPNRVYLGDDGGMYRSDNNGDVAGSTARTCRGSRSTTSPSRRQRPNRIAIGLQDNGSNRSWSNVNGDVADPAAANWSALPSGGDGHYVVIDQSDDTYTYSCSQNAGCSGAPRRSVHDDDAVGGARTVGATNVKLASVTSLVVGDTLTIDPTGANPETVTITTVGTAGATGTGVGVHAGARLRARVAAPRSWKNGVPSTADLSFGSRGSGLRCTTDAPIVTDPTTSRRRSTSAATTCRARRTAAPTGRRSPRADLLTGPAPADDSATNNPLYAGQYPSISTIAPSKSDPNTIYVGTDNGRLWRTTDLGVTWQQFPNPFAPDPPRWVTSVIADPVDAATRTPRSAASARATRRRTSSRRRSPATAPARGQLEEHQRQPAERAGQLPRLRPAPTTRSTRRPTSASTSCRTTTRSGRSSATTSRTRPPRISRSRPARASSTSARSAAAPGGSRSSRARPRYNAQVVTDLVALSSTVTGMHLAAGPTSAADELDRRRSARRSSAARARAPTSTR